MFKFFRASNYSLMCIQSLCSIHIRLLHKWISYFHESSLKMLIRDFKFKMYLFFKTQIKCFFFPFLLARMFTSINYWQHVQSSYTKENILTLCDSSSRGNGLANCEIWEHCAFRNILFTIFAIGFCFSDKSTVPCSSWL